MGLRGLEQHDHTTTRRFFMGIGATKACCLIGIWSEVALHYERTMLYSSWIDSFQNEELIAYE